MIDPPYKNQKNKNIYVSQIFYTKKYLELVQVNKKYFIY
jgi:hypothetical protein